MNTKQIPLKMKNVTNSCGGQGCRIIRLPYDSRLMPVVSGMSKISNDFPKILPLVGILLENKLEAKRPLEKKVA